MGNDYDDDKHKINVGLDGCTDITLLFVLFDYKFEIY